MLAGIPLGVALTLVMGRLARSLLYGSASVDLPALSFATAVLMIVGFAAAIIPGRRAANVDPIKALRSE
jgi:ABC-type antimicrobial peptide transport system permease subunit